MSIEAPLSVMSTKVVCGGVKDSSARDLLARKSPAEAKKFSTSRPLPSANGLFQSGLWALESTPKTQVQIDLPSETAARDKQPDGSGWLGLTYIEIK